MELLFVTIPNDPLTGQSIPSLSPEVIKLFSCSTHLSMKLVLLENLKLLTIANYFLLNIFENNNISNIFILRG